jgi:hypothetical protein
MGNLTETSTFDAHVIELETTDLVLGGPGGPSNAPAQNLTNRTRWLFDQNTANIATLAAHSAHLSALDGDIASIFPSIASINANLFSINNQLPLLAPINSPSFTGTPSGPTPPGGNSSTRFATTQFVVSAIGGLAPLASPAFTGVPTAPTASIATRNSQLATTQFVIPGSSVSANGFRRLPDNGLEQWGSFTKVANQQGHAVTFPTNFTSSCFGVWISSTGGLAFNSSSWTQVLGPISNSGFQVNSDDFGTGTPNPTVTVYWRAEGS